MHGMTGLKLNLQIVIGVINFTELSGGVEEYFI
jgi:hypothetical protein